MSFQQVQADMRDYVRRVYRAKLEGSPIPMGKGIWNVWIREPGVARPRMVKVTHADLRSKTSNDPSRRRSQRDPSGADHEFGWRDGSELGRKLRSQSSAYRRGFIHGLNDKARD